MRIAGHIAMVCVCLTASCVASVAQTREQLEQDIERYSREVEAGNRLLERTRDDQKTTLSDMKIIQSRIVSRRSVIGSLESKLGVINGDMSTKARSVEELDARLGQLRADYAAMVYEAYKNYKLHNFLLLLLSADDFNDATRRLDFMRRYNRMRVEKAGQIAVLSDSISRELASLDRSRTELDSTRRTHNRELASLGRDESQYRSSYDQLRRRETALEKQVRDKQALIDHAQKQIQELIAAELSRARQNNTPDQDQRNIALSGVFEQNRGRLPFPLAGGVVIDRFGRHRHQVVGSVTVDNPGINVAGARGADVAAVFEGVVTGVSPIAGYNTLVMIRHGNYISVYGNLASVAVRPGERVETGQRIGRIGSSDERDANFLHFEIRREMEALDPEQWLRR